jgi:cell shape-determining protein MreC
MVGDSTFTPFLLHIQPSGTPQSGEKVCTSSYSDVFPEGLLVGTLESDLKTKVHYVRSYVPWGKLQRVQVLLHTPRIPKEKQVLSL